MRASFALVGQARSGGMGVIALVRAWPRTRWRRWQVFSPLRGLQTAESWAKEWMGKGIPRGRQ